MADFGAPDKILSEFLTKTLIRWKLRQNDQNCYLFRQRKPPAEVSGIWKSYWICLSCEKVRRRQGVAGTACNLHVRHDGANETILTDPEVGHHHNCVASIVGAMEACQLKREASKDVQKGRKRPLQAYSEAAEDITKRFRGMEQIEVEEHFPTYEHIKRTLYRRAEQSQVQIDDPRYLPVEYQRTTRGRYADRADQFWNERWLLYNAQQPAPPMIIFASDLDLRLLSECHTWIMDGTFKACPKPEFTQLYTIHGYGRFGHEAVPCVSALLSGKTQDQYEALFIQIRQRIGNVAIVRRILVDYEVAAHNAIRAVFPNATITGCNFHFAQTLIRKMHAEGLRERYLVKVPNEEEHAVKVWFGYVKALALLPVQLVPLGWRVLEHDMEHVLPPTLLHQQDIARLRNFAQYFANTWINGAQFDIGVWNHFENDGPRTTNHAEGYHSALNKNAVPEMHMALRNFLHALQQEHNRIQQRIRKLYNNQEAPKSREPIYERLHQDIQNEKALFLNGTAHLWQHNFNAAALANFNRNQYEILVDAIRYFLRMQRRRIGDKVAVH